ncbi:MAG: S-layer homology domain-containing protein [Firmicutes bacterium]|nr:S-layer homology domain-containing protein [Bacillota bacterium]
MKKRFFVMSLCMTLLISIPFVSMAADKEGLKDLNGHWSEGQVTRAVETGWVNGYLDGTFRPEATITRAEFTKMALAADRLIPGSENAAMYESDRYQYSQLYESGKESYKDKQYPEGVFYEAPQESLTDVNNHWLTKQGWTTIALNYGMLVSEDYAHAGYRFYPDKPITRYEMAIIMDRMLGLVYPANENHKDENTGFTDDNSMKDWQRGYVIEAYNAGVLQGYPDGSFHGEKTATRAEAVTMVQNALDYMEKGLDPEITVKTCLKNLYYYDDWDKPVEKALAQIIDGKIYVPLDRCYASDSRSDLQSGFPSRSANWAPVQQSIVFFREEESFLFTAGTEVTGFGMSEDIRRDYLNYSHEYLSVPARMLYGHLMVGLEPVERNDETEENKFPNQQTVFWDADAKTAVFDIRPAPYHWS